MRKAQRAGIPWLLASAFLAAPALAALPPLRPLPELQLSGMDEVIRAGLAAARQEVEQAKDRQPPNLQALADSYGELGRRAFSYELAELAEAALENAAALEPALFRWHYLLGALYQRQRRLEEAARELGAAQTLEPQDPPTLLRRAQVELLRSGGEAARPLFERLVVLDASSAAAHYGLGQIALAAGKPELAATELARALELAPEAAEVAQQLGLAYRELGRLDEARRLLSSPPKGRLSHPDPEVEAAQLKYPFGALFTGVQATQAGRLDEAVAAFEGAVASQPENAVYRSALAAALRQRGDLAGAIAQYRQALRLRPRDALTRQRLAETLTDQLGTPAGEPIELLGQAVELAPELVEVRLALARACLHLGQWRQAIAALEALLAKSPDHLEALLMLGSTHADAAGRDRAEAALRRVLEIGRQPADLSLAHYRLARLELGRGQTREAMHHYQEALLLTPRYRPAQMGLADLLAATGQPAAAIEVLQRALATETDPKDRSLLLFNAAVLEQQGGALEKALTLYGEAAQAAPDSFDPHFYRGGLLGRLGRFGEAAASLARAVEIDPTHAQARLALASALAAAGQGTGATPP